MTLIEAARELNLANNGYTFASNMSPEFLHQAERLVKRSATLDVQEKFFKLKLINSFGIEEDAYLNEQAYSIMKK